MSEVPAAPVLALMAFGVLLAIVGSAAKSPSLQATGIALVFLATAAMIVAGFVAYQSDPNEDPRPTTPRPDPALVAPLGR